MSADGGLASMPGQTSLTKRPVVAFVAMGSAVITIAYDFTASAGGAISSARSPGAPSASASRPPL